MTRNAVLDGVRVLEMAGLGPAPFACMWLADMGASVVRIDRPVAIDYGADVDNDAAAFNRGRRSIALDLKCKEAIGIVLDLVRQCDILIEGYRPGVMEKFGLGPETCLRANPKLVYGRMTGWGQTGPNAHLAGHDINYIGVTGVLDAIGEHDGDPLPPLNLIGDYGGGAMFLVAGVLAALHQAGRTGAGQVVDAAMVDGAAYLTTPLQAFRRSGLWLPERRSNIFDGGAPFYKAYRTRDGKYVAVGAIEEKFYQALLDALDLAELSGVDRWTKSNWDYLGSRFQAVFAERTRAEWSDLFGRIDACVTPILSFDELDEKEERGRSRFMGEDGYALPAPRFSAAAPAHLVPPPVPGQDSVAILRDLGIEPGRIGALIGQGIVCTTDARPMEDN